MRQTTYIPGTLSAMLIIIGALFKIQHWPGAGIMLAVGLLLGAIFVPIGAIYCYRKTEK